MIQLTETEESTVKVPADLWTNDAVNSELCVVGRILSRKPINLEAFERVVLNNWNIARGVRI